MSLWDVLTVVLLNGLLVLAIAFATFYLYMTRNFRYWEKRGIKEVTPRAFFGNFAECIFARKAVMDFVQDIYNAGKGYDAIGFYVLDQPFLMLRDPELIKRVMIKDFHIFMSKVLSGRKDDLLGNSNMFLAKAEVWKHVRPKISPIFTTGKLKKMFESMTEIGNELDIYIDSLNLTGRYRNMEVKDICALFTTDVIGITAYGMRFNSLNNPNAEFRKRGKSIFRSTYSRYLQMLSIFFAPQLLPITRAQFFDTEGTPFLREVFWEAINERLKSGQKRDDLIDLLLNLKKKQDENPNSDDFKLEGDVLVAQAAVFFTGGFETSSATMSYTLYELARNPEMQDRLRKEILDARNGNNGKITYDMIMELPYLNMVVSEALRMYPVLAYVDRVASEDYVFPDTKIKITKGTPVFIPMQALHMDPKYFPIPSRFDPERFNEENRKHIDPNVYFPFGGGPRMCIGMRLGLLQTKLGLMHLLSKCEFSPSDHTLIPLEFDKYNVLTACRTGIQLNMRKVAN